MIINTWTGIKVVPDPPPMVHKDCGASPCDCGQPIWNYVFRGPSGADGWSLTRGRTRAETLVSQQAPDPPECKSGPVQRMSEPPYEFPTTSRCPTCQDSGHVGADHFPCPNLCADPKPKYELKSQVVVTLNPGPVVIPGGTEKQPLIRDQWHLANLLWQVDPRVLDFITLRSEGDKSRRRAVALAVWDRNEGGWRAEAEAKAKAVFEAAKSEP